MRVKPAAIDIFAKFQRRYLSIRRVFGQPKFGLDPPTPASTLYTWRIFGA